MKNFFVLLLTVISLLAWSSNEMLAQSKNKKRASMEIMLSDGSPLQVVVNGRIFKAVNQKIVLNDLPAKRNYIEVIKKCNLAENKNCRDILVFSGNIKFEKGKHYQAVALVGEQKMTVSDKLNLFPSALYPNNMPVINTPTANKPNQPITLEKTEFLNLVELKAQMPADVNQLGAQMRASSDDKTKLSLAEKFVSKRGVASSVNELLVISSWIMFDENKLNFFKSSYSYTSNPSDYLLLQQAFTLQEYSDALIAFVNNN